MSPYHAIPHERLFPDPFSFSSPFPSPVIFLLWYIYPIRVDCISCPSFSVTSPAMRRLVLEEERSEHLMVDGLLDAYCPPRQHSLSCEEPAGARRISSLLSIRCGCLRYTQKGGR
jgi:hypothetical protein